MYSPIQILLNIFTMTVKEKGDQLFETRFLKNPVIPQVLLT